MMRDNLSRELGKALPKDLFIEEEDFGCFRAIVTGCIIAIAFFATLIVLNFISSSIFWVLLTRGL
jgi:hypothetical protein